jgi:hypothetical protein
MPSTRAASCSSSARSTDPLILRWLSAIATCAALAVGCGVLPGTGDSDGDSVGTEGFETPTPDFSTPVPTATPTAIPTVTPTPSPTAPPEPTPTPRVDDSYATFLAQMRAIFTAADKEAAINVLVPAPIPLTIPSDAALERVRLDYGRWDLWSQVTGEFSAFQVASVVVELNFLTSATVDDLRSAYNDPLIAAGFRVDNDSFEEGRFSDVSYELNGGLFGPGTGGLARVSIIGQGDQNFVAVEISTELGTEGSPAITEWPNIFPVPFPGAFTYVSGQAVAGESGIEVISSASWSFGVNTNRAAILEEVMGEYPTASVTMGDTIDQADDDAPASTTLAHINGSTGSVSVDSVPEATTIEFRLLSLPG